MHTLLSRTQAQNETWFRVLPTKGRRIRGSLFPVNPTSLPTSVFVLPRIGMRCRPAEPVQPRDLLRDPAGRTLLVGILDATIEQEVVDSRTYSLFQMVEQVSWTRRVETTHPVTKQKIAAAAATELGPIWVSIESYTHGNQDAGLRITTDRLRAITNARLVVGDVVDGKTVKRVNETLGVTVAEIE